MRPLLVANIVKLALCGLVDVTSRTIYATTLCNVKKLCNSTNELLLFCIAVRCLPVSLPALWFVSERLRGNTGVMGQTHLIRAVCSFDLLLVDLVHICIYIFIFRKHVITQLLCNYWICLHMSFVFIDRVFILSKQLLMVRVSPTYRQPHLKEEEKKLRDGQSKLKLSPAALVSPVVNSKQRKKALLFADMNINNRWS